MAGRQRVCKNGGKNEGIDMLTEKNPVCFTYDLSLSLCLYVKLHLRSPLYICLTLDTDTNWRIALEIAFKFSFTSK